MILTADGELIWPETREVLARPCLCRGKQGWMGLRGSQDLRRRGAIQIDLIVTDGHDGRLSAVSALFAATPSPRWRVAEAAQCAQRHSQARTRRGASGTGR